MKRLLLLFILCFSVVAWSQTTTSTGTTGKVSDGTLPPGTDETAGVGPTMVKITVSKVHVKLIDAINSVYRSKLDYKGDPFTDLVDYFNYVELNHSLKGLSGTSELNCSLPLEVKQNRTVENLFLHYLHNKDEGIYHDMAVLNDLEMKIASKSAAPDAVKVREARAKKIRDFFSTQFPIP